MPAHASMIQVDHVQVSPQGTFLYQSPNDVCGEIAISGPCNMNPVFVNLASIGVVPGDTITVTDFGGLCVFATTPCTIYPASASYLGGVFTTNDILLPPNNLNRLPGAIQTSASNINHNPYLNTYATGVDTTILQDFYLPITIVVPATAQDLVVGTLDSAYADNSGGGLPPNFGVDIFIDTSSPPPPSVPESSTANLLWVGFGLICLARFWDRRKNMTG